MLQKLKPEGSLSECKSRPTRKKDTAFEIYNAQLAYFQRHSRGKINFQNVQDDFTYQQVRFLYLPSFQPYWLFEAFRYKDEAGDDVILSVHRFDHDPERTRAVQNTDDWIVTETVIQNYSSFKITPAEFEAMLAEMVKRGAFDDAATRDGVSPDQSKPICLDGISFYMEISDMDRWTLIDSWCDEKVFQSRLAVAQPLLDIAKQHLPTIAENMRDIDAGLLGFETPEKD
ncbi:MAG: hypothetical protein ACX939_00580 [Hyphococcus sp.]